MQLIELFFVISMITINQADKNEEFCNENNIQIGEWIYSDKLEESSFNRCPILNQSRVTRKYESLKINKYLCVGVQYKSAYFKPSECSLLSLSMSTQLLISSNLNSITYVGDSLNGQLYISTLCELEYLKQHFKINFVRDLYLRPDIPCVSSCITNKTFRMVHRDQFPNHCMGCPLGIPRSTMYNRSTAHLWWMNKVPKDTNILILDTGPWYSAFQGVDQYSRKLIETFDILKTVIQGYVEQGVVVVWMAYTQHLWVDITIFEYRYYLQKHAKFRYDISAMGAIYLDMTLATYYRSAYDPNVALDMIHWW